MTDPKNDNHHPQRLRSADIVEGMTRVPHRAFLRAMGVDESDFGKPMIGVVIGLALILNLMAAGLAGMTIPLILERLGVDPAVASGVFLTTVTDVVGFFTFLGLATWLIL